MPGITLTKMYCPDEFVVCVTETFRAFASSLTWAPPTSASWGSRTVPSTVDVLVWAASNAGMKSMRQTTTHAALNLFIQHSFWEGIEREAHHRRDKCGKP